MITVSGYIFQDNICSVHATFIPVTFAQAIFVQVIFILLQLYAVVFLLTFFPTNYMVT